jgi:hypothetical protein
MFEDLILGVFLGLITGAGATFYAIFRLNFLQTRVFEWIEGYVQGFTENINKNPELVKIIITPFVNYLVTNSESLVKPFISAALKEIAPQMQPGGKAPKSMTVWGFRIPGEVVQMGMNVLIKKFAPELLEEAAAAGIPSLPGY